MPGDESCVEGVGKLRLGYFSGQVRRVPRALVPPPRSVEVLPFVKAARNSSADRLKRLARASRRRAAWISRVKLAESSASAGVLPAVVFAGDSVVRSAPGSTCLSIRLALRFPHRFALNDRFRLMSPCNSENVANFSGHISNPETMGYVLGRDGSMYALNCA